MARRKRSLLSTSALLLSLISSASATTDLQDGSSSGYSGSYTKTTVTLIEVASGIPVLASVIAASSSLTTYSFACRDAPIHPIGSSACSSVAKVALTQGPSSISLVQHTSIQLPGVSSVSTLDVDLACSLTSTHRAVCTQQYVGLKLPPLPVGVLHPQKYALVSANIESITEPKTVTLTGRQIRFSPVVITAGQEKLAKETEAAANSTGSGHQRLQRPPDDLRYKIAPQLLGLGAGLLAIISL